MPSLVPLSCLASLLLAATAATAAGQPPPGPQGDGPGVAASVIRNLRSARQEQLSEHHLRLTGDVDVELERGVRFFADQVDVFLDANRIVGSGNVVFVNPDGRIAAARMEFDTAAETGTFEQATGVLSLGPGVDRAPFGNQEPHVHFHGETIEKTGRQQYRLTRGAFTTCVQPTPRWEFTAGTVVINLHDYAIARNMVLRVKGVPLMYLPVLYYPIQDDDRATGILMPTYGASTLRGQALSNAFFWAIGRSHDATFFHDWFTRAGHGAGTEYRYAAGPQSSGSLRAYRFGQQERAYERDGSTNVIPASTSYEMSGNATHLLAPGVRANARLDYFSDLINQQLYHQDVYEASRTTRVLEGGVSAVLGPLAASVLYQRSESFSSSASSVLHGSTPRVRGSMAPQRLFDAPVYGSLNAEYAHLPYRFMTDGAVTRDDTLHRLDLAPAVRIPLSRLPYLSVNTSAAYRATAYSRSRDASGGLSSERFVRQYATMRSEVIGPVFNRIWDTPQRGFADRLKHVIEPSVAVDVTSPIAEYSRAPLLSDLSDFVIGGSASVTYGLTNRLFSRARAAAGARGQTREMVTLGLQQTYYSNPEASRYDTTYVSTYGVATSRELSPLALSVRVSPAPALDANGRLEYDTSGGGLRALTTGGSTTVGRMSTYVSYSRRQVDRQTPADSYVTATTTTRLLDGRASGTYAVNWDIGRSSVVSQSVSGAYLAQCCGIQVEFQTFNFPAIGAFPIAADRRFNAAVVLAGLGTFSNFFGALGAFR